MFEGIDIDGQGDALTPSANSPHVYRTPLYSLLLLFGWTHLTSMKKEFGLCTRRFLLCLRASCSLGGLSRSISDCSTCVTNNIPSQSPPSFSNLIGLANVHPSRPKVIP